MAEDSIINITEENFESIKHVDENGNEYWYARELMTVLGYKQWRRFEDTINRAKESCQNSGMSAVDCFADVGKTIISGKGKKDTIKAYKLTLLFRQESKN